jgi:hypothetical protein
MSTDKSNNEDVVRVPHFGDKYHALDCGLGDRTSWSEEMPREQAEEEGHDPASCCIGPKGLDDVYRERNLLACALVESVSDVMGGWTPATDAKNDEWAIVWIETPMGQMSWHVPREMANNLVHRNDNYEYDGHSTATKNDRLASWAEEGCWR